MRLFILKNIISYNIIRSEPFKTSFYDGNINFNVPHKNIYEPYIYNIKAREQK